PTPEGSGDDRDQSRTGSNAIGKVGITTPGCSQPNRSEAERRNPDPRIGPPPCTAPGVTLWCRWRIGTVRRLVDRRHATGPGPVRGSLGDYRRERERVVADPLPSPGRAGDPQHGALDAVHRRHQGGLRTADGLLPAG